MIEGLAPGRVAVIGPGRAGTTLAVALQRAGHRIVAVAGGRPASRDRFTGAVAGVRAHDDPTAAVAAADLVLLTTPDDAISEVVTAVAACDGFAERHRVVHCSGAHGLAPLRRAALAGARVAACHPAQTIPSGPPDPDALVGAAWAVTAAPADRGWAHDLVEQLGGDPYDVDDQARVLYHAGLVLGSNAVGAAAAAARRLLLAARIDRPDAFLGPLARTSLHNVLERGAAALTGPIVRGDAGTVAAHLDALDDDLPELALAYRLLSRVILEQVRAELADEDLTALRAALGHGSTDIGNPPS